MLSYQYRNSKYKDKTVLRPSHLHNENPIPGEMVMILKQDTKALLNQGVNDLTTNEALNDKQILS